MLKNKKGFANTAIMLLLVGAVVVAILAVTGVVDMPSKGSGESLLSAKPPSAGEGTSSDCVGIEDVAVFWNDQHRHKVGTDPAQSLVIRTPLRLSLADDANTGNTVPKNSKFEAVAADSQTTYFGEKVSFSTGCADVFIQTPLSQASAATVTIVNDDGVTKNSDTNHDAMDASSEYTNEITIKAPADNCAFRHGTVIAAEYDATYVNSVSSASAELQSKSYQILIAHKTNHSAVDTDFDQWKTFYLPGELCDGEKITVRTTVETTASTPGEDQANVDYHILPLNVIIDADTYEVMDGVLYDEANNAAYLANTTKMYSTA